ncbi:MAG: hypothetical protein KC636_13165, partial [Myxococcales bacterium]|nr:hypothetical protein [Myxococcales bacterium]
MAAITQLLALHLLAAPAEAPATPDMSAHRCSIARALPGLTEGERLSLQAACVRGGAPPPEVHGIIHRLVSSPDWRASALAELLSGLAPAASFTATPSAGEDPTSAALQAAALARATRQ